MTKQLSYKSCVTFVFVTALLVLSGCKLTPKTTDTKNVDKINAGATAIRARIEIVREMVQELPVDVKRILVQLSGVDQAADKIQQDAWNLEGERNTYKNWAEDEAAKNKELNAQWWSPRQVSAFYTVLFWIGGTVTVSIVLMLLFGNTPKMLGWLWGLRKYVGL